MPYFAEGDSAIYEECTDPACPDIEPGWKHAHVNRVIRSERTPESWDCRPGPRGWHEHGCPHVDWSLAE